MSERRLLPGWRPGPAQFTAQTLDNKPMHGAGELRPLRITYDQEMKPVETLVERWALNTDEQGRAEQ